MALAVDPQNAGLFAGSAMVSGSKFDRDQAIADINKAIGLNPKDEAVLPPPGVLLDHETRTRQGPGRCEPGLAAFTPLRLGSPGKGLGWMAKGDYARAITDVDEILKRNPGDRLQHLYRSGLYYVRGDYARALADFRDSAFKDPRAERWLQDAVAGKATATPHGKAVLTAKMKRRMLRGEYNVWDKAIDGDLCLDVLGLDFVYSGNAHCSRGATPQNNAAVLLYEAFGPVATPWTASDAYYQMLEMKRPPEQGSYLVALADFGVKLNEKDPRTGILDDAAAAEAWKPFALALERPWAIGEFPRLARCIAANRMPLAKIAEASCRSKYYCPVIDSFLTCPRCPSVPA